MSEFTVGQRWISEAEPELGLGIVTGVRDRTVTVVFRAAGESREYSRRTAPLVRVEFRAGDTVRDRNDRLLLVRSAASSGGVLSYATPSGVLEEGDLSDTLSFSRPEERLRVGMVDPPALSDLRMRALRAQFERRRSPLRGFLGGRVDLIPHQLFIAAEVAGRRQPRVLLADEVGLGKTIEACLILHRLMLTGRVSRALVLVPESLVHQWFVELLRRFNLWFHIFDEGRCAAIEEADATANPFMMAQTVLAPLRWLASDARRLDQAVEAGWDMLVVDEAHHLQWSPVGAAPEYMAVESIGKRSPGLMLLTGTPEQLGRSSHFARLRLLDPDRFHDLDTFLKEEEGYRAVAKEAEALLQGSGTGEGGSDAAISRLIDCHGTGRVHFRNTRSAIAGFPRRVVNLIPLDRAAGDGLARMDWLVRLLANLDPEKVLLVCRAPATVVAIEAALRQRCRVAAGVFHEGLSLVQRDRNAAWFAEPQGARLLVCSEIGSEGRNFQFAHHLVLFDLPLDPELLEQRIGRLDRIGQKEDVRIHVPFTTDGPDEVLARWFHDGMNAFAAHVAGGRELFERFGGELHDLAREFQARQADGLEAPRDRLDELLRRTRLECEELAVRLHEGRDRLLEWSSFRPLRARQLVQEIEAADRSIELDEFMMAVFEHFALTVEQIGDRTWRLGSSGVLADTFPGLPQDGFSMTRDRRRALVREEVQFLTWDHPLVSGALDLLLGSGAGNCSFIVWKDAQVEAWYLEATFVLECVAPLSLHIDRFLPPTPVRAVVDANGADARRTVTTDAVRKSGAAGSRMQLRGYAGVIETEVPRMLDAARRLADRLSVAVRQRASETGAAQLDDEVQRLNELREVNPAVRADEIAALHAEREAVLRHIQASRLRLDCIRLIHRGSVRAAMASSHM